MFEFLFDFKSNCNIRNTHLGPHYLYFISSPKVVGKLEKFCRTVVVFVNQLTNFLRAGLFMSDINVLVSLLQLWNSCIKNNSNFWIKVLKCHFCLNFSLALKVFLYNCNIRNTHLSLCYLSFISPPKVVGKPEKFCRTVMVFVNQLVNFLRWLFE